MALLPGSTIGILGGGQLGRMTAMAARELGYRIRVLDPDASCAARFVVDECITADFDDEVAAAWLAHRSDVVTLEIEKIALSSLAAAERLGPVRPSREVLRIVQDRALQKTWLSQSGFDVGPYRVVNSAAQLREAVTKLGGRCFVKASHGGYDGRGQVEISRPDEAEQAFSQLGSGTCVVEKGLALDCELSVLVARRPQGEVAVYPPALNHHEERILAWSVIPAPVADKIAARAEEIGRALATRLSVEGVLVVELFVVGNELYVNELAPRPHNSFHATLIACETSQFEQHTRAVCDLPLGSTLVRRPAAIANLLGDLWEPDAPRFHCALELPGVRLHLYGKREARPGRKMGHLSATGDTPQAAVESVQRAYAALRAGNTG